LLGASLSACDPLYGPAVRSKKIRRTGGERSCINVSGLRLELCSGPLWISARLRSH